MRFFQLPLGVCLFIFALSFSPQSAHAGPKRDLKKAMEGFCINVDVEAVAQLSAMYSGILELSYELQTIVGSLSSWDFEFNIEECLDFGVNWDCQLDLPNMDALMQCFGDFDFSFQCNINLPDFGGISECIDEILNESGAGCDFDVDFSDEEIRQCMENQFNLPDLDTALSLLQDISIRLSAIMEMDFWTDLDINISSDFFPSLQILAQWCDRNFDTFFDSKGWRCR